jgi:putative transposase
MAGFDQPTRRRERQMKRFKSAGQARFLSAHDQINNLFHLRRDRASRTQTFQTWEEICSTGPMV